MSEFRRKLLANSDSSIPSVSSYIQNGLVFQLDGIEKGVNIGKWTDLIGGVIYKPNSGVTALNNGFSFNNGYMEGDKRVNFTPYTNNYTFECVFKNGVRNDWRAIFVLNGTWHTSTSAVLGIDTTYANEYRLNFTYTNGTYNSNRAKNLYVYNTSDYIYAHINTSNWLITNFSWYDSSGDRGWTSSNNNNSYIGARYGGSGIERRFIGDIYAIRAYNRKLSLAEMEYNQQIDEKRFQLPTS